MMSVYTKGLFFLCVVGVVSFSCQNQREKTAREQPGAQELIFPEDSWLTRSPSEAGFDSLSFAEAIQFLEDNFLADGLHEMMIIKDGYLIFEGDSVDKVHPVWSVTKSVVSTLFGILHDKGVVQLTDTVAKVLPYLETQYADVRYRHFLTLTSGYDAEGASNPKQLEKYGFGDSSPTPWMPAEPLFAPGNKFCYWDESMNAFAHAVTRLAGQPLQQFFKNELADKIGIQDSGWIWPSWNDARGDTLNGGAGCCKAINISARQLSRFGYLFLRKGKWKDNRVVSEDWISQATIAQVDTALAIMDGPRRQIDARGAYGFNWWVNDVTPQGTYLMPDTPKGTYFASGFNNNMIYIIPEWDLLLVRTGIDGNPPDKYGVYNTFFKLLSESFKN